MPTVLLAIYIALIFIRPMEWWDPILQWPLINASAMVTLLFSFPRFMNEHLTLWRRLPQFKLIMAMLLAATWSGMYFNLSGMNDNFQVFGKIVVLFMLVILLSRDPKNLRFLTWVVFLCVTWLAVHTVLQINTGQGFGWQVARWRPDREVFQPRAYGIFGDPNDLCIVFVIAIPMLYAEFRAARNPLAKLPSLALIPLMGYAVHLTHSRGGLVGVAGMLNAYLLAKTKGKIRWLFAFVSIILFTVVLPRWFVIDIGRLNAWGDGIQMWKRGFRSIFFGVGFGRFAEHTEDWTAAHNSFIEPLTELGLTGYIPYFTLLFMTLLHSSRLSELKRYMDHQSRFYVAGYQAAIIGYLTSGYFLSRTYNHVLYILLGFTICNTIIVCRRYNLGEQVYGNITKDIRRGAKWALISVPIIWITVRIGNLGR